jgi:hypothetical protein
MNQIYFTVEGTGSLDAYLVEYYFVFWVNNLVFSASIRNHKSMPKNFDRQFLSAISKFWILLVLHVQYQVSFTIIL